jgi:hypothetical protein
VSAAVAAYEYLSGASNCGESTGTGSPGRSQMPMALSAGEDDFGLKCLSGVRKKFKFAKELLSIGHAYRLIEPAALGLCSMKRSQCHRVDDDKCIVGT